MSYWNYRLVKYYHKAAGYAIHEVYYDDDGKPTGMTVNPCSFVGDTPEETVDALTMALKDAQERDIFEEPEEWAQQI